MFERLWLEPPGGGRVESSIMKLREEERRKAHRMYHAGCIVSAVPWQACEPAPSLAGSHDGAPQRSQSDAAQEAVRAAPRAAC